MRVLSEPNSRRSHMLYGCVPGLLAGLGGIDAVVAPRAPAASLSYEAEVFLDGQSLGAVAALSVPLRRGHRHHRPVPYAEAGLDAPVRIEPQRSDRGAELSSEQNGPALDAGTLAVVRTPARAAMSGLPVIQAALLGLAALPGGRR